MVSTKQTGKYGVFFSSLLDRSFAYVNLVMMHSSKSLNNHYINKFCWSERGSVFFEVTLWQNRKVLKLVVCLCLKSLLTKTLSSAVKQIDTPNKDLICCYLLNGTCANCVVLLNLNVLFFYKTKLILSVCLAWIFLPSPPLIHPMINYVFYKPNPFA